jgi:hypothetical protein
MAAMTECHITSCHDTGTVRLMGRCISGHRLDALFCAPHGANHGRLLAEGELNCTECYEAGNMCPWAEIIPELAPW